MPTERLGKYGLFDPLEFATLALALKVRLHALHKGGDIVAEMSDGTAEFADNTQLHVMVIAIPGGAEGRELYNRCVHALDTAGLKDATTIADQERVEFPW